MFIISEDVAKRSIIPIIDWIFRDAETRQDMILLVSKEEKAGDILRIAHGRQDVLSIQIFEMIEFQEELSKAPIIFFWKIAKDLNEDTVCSAIPIISLITQNNEKIVNVGGTSVFRDAKAIGELSEEETMYYLFVKDQIKGGIIPVEMRHGDNVIKLSLEIYESKTKLSFNGENKNEPVIEVNVNTDVFIGEVDDDMDPTEYNMMKGIEKLAEEDIEENIVKVCNKVLREYNSDIFGFAKCIKDNDPETWREYSNNYDEIMTKIKVKAKAKVTIILGGLLSKEVPIK